MDRYTKIVLTIIAVCLVWIAFRPVTRVPAAYAAIAPQGGPVAVNIVQVGGSRVMPTSVPGSLPVVIWDDLTK